MMDEINKKPADQEPEAKNDPVVPQTYVCFFCSRPFAARKSLVDHLRNHPESFPHKCMECKKSFFSEAALKNHISGHSKKRQSESDTVSKSPKKTKKTKRNSVSPSPTEKRTKSYQCVICKHEETSAIQMINHVELHLKTSGYHNNIIELKNFSKESSICELCDIKFSNVTNLRHHLYLHMDYKPFDCENCGKRFTNKNACAKHIKFNCNGNSNQQENITTFHCVVCNKFLSSNSGLKKHLKLHNSKNFNCETCQKTFMNKANLRQHAFVHQMDLKYKKEELVKNEETQKSEDEKAPTNIQHTDKIWKCEICGKGFNLVTKLKNHESAHGKITLYDCDLCDEAFELIDDLNKHRIIHNQPMTYQYSICSKMFSKNSELANHKLIHDKDNTAKPTFECKVCKKKYKMNYNLKIHMLRFCKGRKFSEE